MTEPVGAPCDPEMPRGQEPEPEPETESEPEHPSADPSGEPSASAHHPHRARRFLRRACPVLVAAVYLVGVGTGWAVWGSTPPPAAPASTPADASSSPMVHAEPAAVDPDVVNPPEGVTLPVAFGTLGPRLIAAGAIDRAAFEQLYAQSGRPFTAEQLTLLTDGSDRLIVIRKDNAQFLLNLLWATGLANRNDVLTDGPMMKDGKAKVVGFASTGGWTLASKPIPDLYAAVPLISLNREQQARLEEVARAVYRPCCDNSTYFPDCNHGMAMLGLLEIMAARDASVDEMFAAAKTVNAFWFPQQTIQLATMLKQAKNVDFGAADARLVVGELSSASGSRAVGEWLAQNNGRTGADGGGGGSCGVE